MTEFSRVLHSGSWKMFPRQCVTFITGITLSHSCVVLPPSRVSHSLAALQPRFYMIIRAEVLISVPVSSVWFYEILQPCDSRAWVFLLKELNSPWLKLLICPLTRATAVSWLDQRCPPVLSWILHAHLFGLLLDLSMKYSPLVSSTSPCGKRLTVYLLYWGDSTSKEALFVFIARKGYGITKTVYWFTGQGQAWATAARAYLLRSDWEVCMSVPFPNSISS